MKIINTVQQWKDELLSFGADRKIGFVPTMGGLHEGHLSLVEKCRSQNDICVVSIYLNPTQFNDRKDFLTYPADFDDDVRLLESAGADYLFAPDYNVMYPDNFKYKVTECDFSRKLCGAARPGHFDGVLTVVMKLFNIIRPQNAYFGEKDYQQLKLLQGMTGAFFLDVNIVPCPVVRTSSGLAVSSRNRKLSKAALEKAPLLHSIISSGISVGQKEKLLSDSGFKVDYVTEYNGRIFAAVFLEDVRLIDNVSVSECR